MKKIFLFSLIVCMGAIDAGFAGNCTMSNRIGRLRDSIVFGASGDQGLFCGASGAKTCNYSDFVLIRGRHSGAGDVVEDFRVYKCIDVKLKVADEWQKGHESELQPCNKGRHGGYKEIGRDGGYVYLAKERLSHGSVVYAAGSKAGMCRIAISEYNPDDFCDNCSGKKEKGCIYNDGEEIASYGSVMANMDCSGTIQDPAATGCICTCLEGGTWRCDVEVCSGGKTSNKNKTNSSGGKGVCEEKKGNYCGKYKKYDKRYACCVAGKSTKWNGEDLSNNGNCKCVDEAMTWNGKKCIKKSGTTCEDAHKGNDEAIACCNNNDSSWNSDSRKCECTNGNKNWKYDEKTKTGKCIDNGSVVNPGSTTTCTKTDCVITIKQSIKCSYNDNYLNSTENYPVCKEDLDARNLNCDDLKAKVSSCGDTDCIKNWLTRIEKYDELIARVCGGSGVVTNPGPDNGAEILAAENTLTSFFRNAESDASVWKDKDGNFNTARLASDLTAGVVLGTVGGVVSGVVIKKKQVEKGFDALHCTVGGQPVADWGDIFNVGLRR